MSNAKIRERLLDDNKESEVLIQCLNKVLDKYKPSYKTMSSYVKKTGNQYMVYSYLNGTSFFKNCSVTKNYLKVNGKIYRIVHNCDKPICCQKQVINSKYISHYYSTTLNNSKSNSNMLFLNRAT